MYNDKTVVMRNAHIEQIEGESAPVLRCNKAPSCIIIDSTFKNCNPPVGDFLFIDCELPAEWKDKVQAVGCTFIHRPNRRVKAIYGLTYPEVLTCEACQSTLLKMPMSNYHYCPVCNPKFVMENSVMNCGVTK